MNNNIFKQNLLYSKEVLDVQRKNNIAEQLINQKINSNDLSNEEIREMIEYFEKDIAKKKEEIIRIKCNILELKEKINK